MLKLNNKGQTLVLFVILAPILLLILVMVYDLGNAFYEKERLNNVNYMVIDYGLDNIDTTDENDLIDLIRQNTSNMNSILVVIEENIITVELNKEIKGIIGNMFGFKIIDVKSKYEGQNVDGKKRIERIK